MRSKLGSFPNLEVNITSCAGKIQHVTLQTSDQGFFVTFNEKPLSFCLDWLTSYIKKQPIPIPQKLFDLSHMTKFEQSVLYHTHQIAFSEKLSYFQLGKLMGKEKSVRAIGTALGKNRYPLFIPCHRIVKKDGKIGGYAFGPSIKKELLDFETTY